ncbi:MAG TPA: aspartyl-phosphate phosphatase Spo0E family protein [Clostridia bacterium]|nr:aspartyl-phosphate phosphatase Spo0E family protein [Clostridia bacterium]
MKNSRPANYKSNINQLRNELHHLIDSENLTSTIVQKRSRELDELILLYYKHTKNCQELNDP